MRLIAPLIALLALAGCDVSDFGPSDRFKEDFHITMKPHARLDLQNDNGEVEISGWDQDSVDITGVKYSATEEGLKDLKVDVRESGDAIQIRTVRHSLHFNQGARYTVRLPKTMALDRIVTSNGPVRIHDMTAGATVRTSNGPVNVENLTGHLDAETSNGPVEIDSVRGKVVVRTSNGRIRAREIDGGVEATTSNGPVDIALSARPKAGIKVDTSNGPVTIELPADTSARLDARSNTSVNSEFSVDGESTDHSGHRLEGNIGGGGPSIEVNTSNGPIHIRKTGARAN